MNSGTSLLAIAKELGINRRKIATLAARGLVVEGDFGNPLGIVAISQLEIGGENTRELRRPEVAQTDGGPYTVFLEARR